MDVLWFFILHYPEYGTCDMDGFMMGFLQDRARSKEGKELSWDEPKAHI